ncbi:hypothetical protein VN24_07975 [Paenibacillus beijingensis]|uniref:Uncharacterized protein n=1 Tax=Paenibacillus beijingensis TaxID=1126833 RepID=A0A0D5NGV8_9BACL|nr:hypothetical protein VN24_07975 [Paenibacillus beijingensis]
MTWFVSHKNGFLIFRRETNLSGYLTITREIQFNDHVLTGHFLLIILLPVFMIAAEFAIKQFNRFKRYRRRQLPILRFLFSFGTVVRPGTEPAALTRHILSHTKRCKDMVKHLQEDLSKKV